MSLADLIDEAALRQDTLQTEAAINLAIGYTLNHLGEKVLEIAPDALIEFAKTHRVEVETKPDGTFVYRVVKR